MLFTLAANFRRVLGGTATAIWWLPIWCSHTLRGRLVTVKEEQIRGE